MNHCFHRMPKNAPFSFYLDPRENYVAANSTGNEEIEEPSVRSEVAVVPALVASLEEAVSAFARRVGICHVPMPHPPWLNSEDHAIDVLDLPDIASFEMLHLLGLHREQVAQLEQANQLYTSSVHHSGTLEIVQGVDRCTFATITINSKDENPLAPAPGAHIALTVSQLAAPKDFSFFGLVSGIASPNKREFTAIIFPVTESGKNVSGDCDIIVEVTHPVHVSEHQMKVIASLGMRLPLRLDGQPDFRRYFYGQFSRSQATRNFLEDQLGRIFALREAQEDETETEAKLRVLQHGNEGAVKKREDVLALFSQIRGIIDQSFDVDQREAIYKALLLGTVITIIQGPPSTGKSSVTGMLTVASAICGIAVLLVAPSNGAADRAMDCIIKAIGQLERAGLPDLANRARELLPSGKVIRIYSSIADRMQTSDPRRLEGESRVTEDFAEQAVLAEDIFQKRSAMAVRAVRSAIGHPNLSVPKTIEKFVALPENSIDPVCEQYHHLQRTLLAGNLSRDEKKQFSHVKSILAQRLLSSVLIVVKTIATGCSWELHLQPRLLLIDEAGQANESQVVTEMNRYETLDRAVLVGDDKQLRPCVLAPDSEVAPHTEGSPMARLITVGNTNVTKLTHNYRAHPQLTDFVAREVYDLPRGFKDCYTEDPVLVEQVKRWARDGNLQHLTASVARRDVRWLVFDVSGHHMSVPGSSSLRNPSGASAVLEIVSSLVASGVDAGRIGVTTYYVDDKHQLRQGWMAIADKSSVRGAVDIRCVDGFQGREYDIMLLHLVRSHPSNPASYGFVIDEYRLNVALSRARHFNFIVGDVGRLLQGLPKIGQNRKYRVFRSWLQYLRANSARHVVQYVAPSHSSFPVESIPAPLLAVFDPGYRPATQEKLLANPATFALVAEPQYYPPRESKFKKCQCINVRLDQVAMSNGWPRHVVCSGRLNQNWVLFLKEQ